jgi:hypothetical protein
MARTRTRSLILVTVLTSLVVVAGASGAGGNAMQRKVPPSKWVAGVCSTLGDWKDGLDGAVSEETKALPSVKKLHGTARVRKAKAIVQTLVRESVAITKKASKGLGKVGEPDVANGADLNAVLITGFSRILRGFEQAEHAAAALPTNSESAFNKQARRLGLQLSQLGQRARKDFATLRKRDTSGAVIAAIAVNSSCSSLSGAVPG